VRVLLAAEIGRAQSSPGVAVAFVLLDGKGKVAAQGSQRSRPDAPPGPLRFTTSVVVEPGLYTLRLAARDRSGRPGTVEHPVKGALNSLPAFEVSDLLLGIPPPPGGAFQPAVDLGVSEGVLVSHLELYGKDLDKAAVQLEVAKADDAPALKSVAARLATSPDPTRRVAQAVVDVADLPPGLYVARAVVSAGGPPIGAVSAPFRVVPKAP
jgi:hypothetical protein